MSQTPGRSHHSDSESEGSSSGEGEAEERTPIKGKVAAPDTSSEHAKVTRMEVCVNGSTAVIYASSKPNAVLGIVRRAILPPGVHVD